MVRALDVATGVLPRVHGSAVFTRGETQAIVAATLGTERVCTEYRRDYGCAHGSLHVALQLPLRTVLVKRVWSVHRSVVKLVTAV